MLCLLRSIDAHSEASYDDAFTAGVCVILDILASGGLQARVTEPEPFAQTLFEKHLA
jgi:hypothetical protein